MRDKITVKRQLQTDDSCNICKPVEMNEVPILDEEVVEDYNISTDHMDLEYTETVDIEETDINLPDEENNQSELEELGMEEIEPDQDITLYINLMKFLAVDLTEADYDTLLNIYEKDILYTSAKDLQTDISIIYKDIHENVAVELEFGSGLMETYQDALNELATISYEAQTLFLLLLINTLRPLKVDLTEVYMDFSTCLNNYIGHMDKLISKRFYLMISLFKDLGLNYLLDEHLADFIGVNAIKLMIKNSENLYRLFQE